MEINTGNNPAAELFFISLSMVAYGFVAHSAPEFMLSFLLLFIAAHAIGQGAVIWVFISEIFPNKIRSLALAISVFIQWVANFVVTQVFPSLVENQWLKDHFNGAFPFYLFSIICLFSIYFIYKYIPETKNKSLEEINELWKI